MPNAVPWWANPLLSTLLAILVAGIAVSFDRRKTVNQELIRKRILVYDQMAPLLNDLLCFFRSFGRWDELRPPDMVKHKRDLDRLFHVHRWLFSARLFGRYKTFINSAFVTYQGFGTPALLRAPIAQLKGEWRGKWQADWDQCFRIDRESDPRDVERLYHVLMDQFAVEIGTRRTHRLWLRPRDDGRGEAPPGADDPG